MDSRAFRHEGICTRPWKDHDVIITIRAKDETKYVGTAKYFDNLTKGNEEHVSNLAADASDFTLSPQSYEPTEILRVITELSTRGAIIWERINTRYQTVVENRKFHVICKVLDIVKTLDGIKRRNVFILTCKGSQQVGWQTLDGWNYSLMQSMYAAFSALREDSYCITGNRRLTSEDGTKTVDRQGALWQLEPSSDLVRITSRPNFSFAMTPHPVRRVVPGWLADALYEAGYMGVVNDNDPWQAVALWKVIEYSLLQEEVGQTTDRTHRIAKKRSTSHLADEDVNALCNEIRAIDEADDAKRAMILCLRAACGTSCIESGHTRSSVVERLLNFMFVDWYTRDALEDDDEDIAVLVGVLNVLAGDAHRINHSRACDAVLDADDSRLEKILAILASEIDVDELRAQAETKATSLSLSSITPHLGPPEDDMSILDHRVNLQIGSKTVLLENDVCLSLQKPQPNSFNLREGGKRLCKMKVAEGKLQFTPSGTLRSVVKKWLSSISGVGLQVMGTGGNISWREGSNANVDEAPNMILSGAFGAEAACWLLHHLMAGNINVFKKRPCYLVGLGRESEDGLAITAHLSAAVTARLKFLYDGCHIYLNTPVEDKVLKVVKGHTRYSSHVELVRLGYKEVSTCSVKRLPPIGSKELLKLPSS